MQCALLLRQIDTRNTRILLIGLADQQTCTLHALDCLGQRRQFHSETGCQLRLREALFSPEHEDDQLLRHMQTELAECFFRSLAMLFRQLDELIVQALFKAMRVHFAVPFTLPANYIRLGRDLSRAVKNKGSERGGIQRELRVTNPSHRAQDEYFSDGQLA